MNASFLGSVRAYVGERGRPGIFIPAAILIALAANIGDAIEILRLGAGAVLALLLIAQFRLWDDLADIEADRLRHPERVLSRTAHLDGFVLFGLSLATLNIAIAAWLTGPVGAVLSIVLDAAMAAWYGARQRRRTVFGDLAILAKYPTLVFIVAGSASPAPSQIAGAIAVYATACVFEIWHDASSPLRRRVNA